MALTPTPIQPWAQRMQQQSEPMSGDIAAPWIDQLNQNMLLTVQAFQRLHAALNEKFTR
jgi:hypothetical protein